MALPQRAAGRVVHDEKWRAALDAKFEDAHDIGVNEAGDSTGLRAEPVRIVRYLRIEHFDSCLRAEIDMLSEIDLRKATFP
jgi:hypothetical protein